MIEMGKRMALKLFSSASVSMAFVIWVSWALVWMLHQETASSKKWPNFSFLKGNWSKKYILFENTLLVTEIGFFKTLPKRIKILENRSGFGGGVSCSYSEEYFHIF